MPPCLAAPSRPTAWETKLRNFRLQNETPEIRAWRAEAEAPNTTGERLKQIAEAVKNQNKQTKRHGDGKLVKEAIARHPNTPPATLVSLFWECASAFCQNPVAPFVLLEMPYFVTRLGNNFYHLLCEEDIPFALLHALLNAPSEPPFLDIGKEAHLHIALAGEVPTREDGELGVKAFWQDDCAYHSEKLCEFMQPNGDLVELGFAPDWLNEPAYYAAPRTPEIAPEVRQWLEGVVPDSREEGDLWARIAPGFASRPEFAAHIRANADEDLMALATLANTRESRRGYLLQALAVHPNATPFVLERFFRCQMLRNSDYYPNKVLSLIATHPNTSRELLSEMVQSPDAEVRRLARRHKNAPANSLYLSRQAVLNFGGRGTVEEVPLPCL